MPPRPPTPYGIRQYRLDVELICDAANNLNAKAMLVTQAHLTSDLRDKAPWEALRMDEAAFLKCHDECADALRDVALRKGAELVDASAQMSGKAEYFIDVVHLTPEGAERLAELVAARLGPLLRAGRP
jgi:lysophospholipase L1-like esterase